MRSTLRPAKSLTPAFARAIADCFRSSVMCMSIRSYWCSPNSSCRARNKLAERLLLVRHHVRKQQRVKQAIALRQMLADADAARLLADR